MANQVTLDGAPVPISSPWVRAAAVVGGGGAFGCLLLFVCVLLPFGLIEGLFPHAIDRYTAPIGLDRDGLPGAAWWGPATLLGMVLIAADLQSQGRWRSSHNRLPMTEISRRLRTHRLRQRGGRLRWARAWGWINLAAWPCLFVALPLLRTLGPGLRPVAVIVALILLLFLLINAVRLLSTSIPLGRFLWIGVARIAIFAAPFVGLLLLSAAGIFWAMELPLPPEPLPGLLALTAVPLWLWLASRYWRWVEPRWSDKLLSAGLARAVEVRRADRRPPVVYLRSFKDEFAATRSRLHDADPDDGLVRIEDLLADEAEAFGPVIAIGEPGAAVRSGAARAWFPGAEWQAEVGEWIDEAQFVLIVAGITEGVSWELERVLAGGHASKSIVVFPPGDDRLAARWDLLRSRARANGVAFLPERPVKGAIMVCLDRFGDALVLTSSKPDRNQYRAGLRIALLERFAL